MPIGRAGGGWGPPAASSTFPLSVHSSGRYLLAQTGQPFLLHGDTAWSIVAQLTNTQIDTYLNDRQSRGVNAVIFNAPEAWFTNATPSYNNADGVAPFTTMSPVDWTSPVTAYWNRVDYLVNGLKSRGMVAMFFPAYLGANDNEGWRVSLASTSDANLQTYGAFLANRYTQGNVIWCMGGDYQNNDAASITKQWNIVTGMRTVRTTDIITGHAYLDAYPAFNGNAGFNLNSSYGAEDFGDFFYTFCGNAYGRSGPLPFFHLEGRYEQETATPITAVDLRKQSYAAMLSGACGQFFGNNPIWHFESSKTLFSYSGTWNSNLASTGSQQQQYVRALFLAYAWWKLQPKTDTSLVSSSLSTGTTRIYPALASDGTFAMIYVPSSQTITVVTTALTGISGNVRIRRYNTSDGTYTVLSASIAKSSAESVATGAEGVIVIDAP